MSMLDQLSQADCWERFYSYKESLACPKQFTAALRTFIDCEEYRPVCEAIARGERFPIPRKAIISKMHSLKKRTVYTYPERENTVMKLLTYLLLRRYDGIFSGNLFSFRPNRTAKDAVRFLTHTHGISEMYAYKADISNYFNSVPVDRLLGMLRAVTADDPLLYAFLDRLLLEPQVIDKNRVITEEKGIMAGTPLSSFYANLYLMELDHWFWERRIPYARYSDDIILFAQTKADCEACAQTVRETLAERGLRLNPDKEAFSEPHQPWSFLGFCYCGGRVDIAPVSAAKIKAKMRRKARALARWRDRNDMTGEKAAAAFIRIFNRKLMESGSDHELTWSYWFFPVITTSESLRVIDLYAQDCIRFLISGTRTKARYRVRYADMKRLGYRSLVHEYYAHKKATGDENGDQG